MKRKQKERRLEAAKLARKEAMGDYSHLKNKKGELVAKPLPQPTLPNLSVDDDDNSSMATRVPPSSASTYTYSQDFFYNSEKSMDYPPMPTYNPYSHHPAPGAPTYNPSFGYEDQYTYPSSRPFDDDADSIAKLAPSFTRDSVDRQASPYYAPSTQGNKFDPVDVYQGRAAYTPATATPLHAIPPPTDHVRIPSSGSGGGLVYDDGYATEYQTQPAYPTQHSRYVDLSRGGREETGRGGYQGGYAA